MNAIDKIGAALLIVLLLPAVVAEWERWRLPDIFHAALAAGGLAFAAVTGGMVSFAIAGFGGLGTLVLLSGAATVVRSAWDFRPLTGGNIKLLAAGSVWLGAGALLLAPAVAALVLLAALLLRARNGHAVHPGFSPLAAVATIGIFLSQGLIGAMA